MLCRVDQGSLSNAEARGAAMAVTASPNGLLSCLLSHLLKQVTWPSLPWWWGQFPSARGGGGGAAVDNPVIGKTVDNWEW